MGGRGLQEWAEGKVCDWWGLGRWAELGCKIIGLGLGAVLGEVGGV